VSVAEAEVPEVAVAPEVAAIAGTLRKLWPAMGALTAQQHARTLVRVLERHHGPADEALASQLVVLNTPAASVAEPELPDDLVVEVPRQPGLFLRPWTEEMDRRPGPGRYADPRWQPGGEFHAQQMRGGKLYCGSAKKGECTPCVKDGRLRKAIYRVSNDRDTYSRSSVCSQCAKKMLGTPVVVPKFDTPEEAQAWLDAQE
jgi:hypothetical protein